MAGPTDGSHGGQWLPRGGYRLCPTPVLYFAVRNLEAEGESSLPPATILRNLMELTSLYGYHLETTPVMAELGRESLVFTNMYANCNSDVTLL